MHLILGPLMLSDLKADIFLAANLLDAVLTYLALTQDALLVEFNSILCFSIDKIGIEPTLFLKIVMAMCVLWALRWKRRERLLLPLAVVLSVVVVANLMVMRAHGIEV
ncbi:MAG: DUF5658 family protein [Dehalococcoidia bacterium]|nr:DUF5658 family protein [Dehalococcoidia bacterium]